jgi:hypothetical protein
LELEPSQSESVLIFPVFYTDLKMIRNIITTVIFVATLVSMVSVAQVANAVEPELNLELSAYEDRLTTTNHPFAWTPDMAQQQKVMKLYNRMTPPRSIKGTQFSESTSSDQRLFSFEIYQGDGLEDLRSRSKHHNDITLPEEDTDAYGVTIKQRF